MTDHLWAEIEREGYILSYAWQDGELFRVVLRKRTPKGDYICAGIGITFDDALEEAASGMKSWAEFHPAETKTQTWSIDRSPELTLSARLGIGNHAPITRRF